MGAGGWAEGRAGREGGSPRLPADLGLECVAGRALIRAGEAGQLPSPAGVCCPLPEVSEPSGLFGGDLSPRQEVRAGTGSCRGAVATDPQKGMGGQREARSRLLVKTREPRQGRGGAMEAVPAGKLVPRMGTGGRGLASQTACGAVTPLLGALKSSAPSD